MRLTSNISNLKWSKIFFAVFVLCVICGCVSNSSKKQSSAAPVVRVWPQPPDAPRVAYIRSIRTPADVGIKTSALRRFGSWIAGGDVDDKRLLNPLGIALDEKGNLCITDTGANTICYYDATAKRWQQWNRIGAIYFATPVAVAKRGDAIFVADSDLAEVLAFNTAGKLLFQINHDLGRPSGLTILGERLFVADAGQHCVTAFDLHGNRLFSFGQRGTNAGEFNFPTHAASDAQGRLFITDSLNSRVQVFDTNGKFISQIGSAGDTSGHFGRPKGVAVDTFGHIYVADSVFDNIQVFDLTGQLLLNFGENGAGPGEFGLPNGIAIGADNQIYVADSYNHRVQIFKYVGQQ